MAGFSDNARTEDTEVNGWIRFGLRLGVSAALHPLEYSKTLMQLGYEPIAPRPGKSFLGKPVMELPNIFQYGGFKVLVTAGRLIPFLSFLQLATYGVSTASTAATADWHPNWLVPLWPWW